MAIKGSLGEVSLADVLQLLALGRKTGCLAVFDRHNFGRIYLEGGRITHASIVNRKDRLGDLLLKNGVIGSTQLAAAIAQQKGQNPPRLGELLVAANAITREHLEQYIAIQIEEAVYFLFTWTRGDFHFQTGDRPDAGEVLVSINPERVLLEGARRVDEWALIEKKIPALDIVFAPVSGQPDLEHEDLTAEQRGVHALVDGQRSVREVVEASGLLEFEALKALYAIVQAGLARPCGRKQGSDPQLDRSARLREHQNLGAAFYQTGMLDEAERELVRVTELDPSSWEAQFRLASIEVRKGLRRDAARRLMRIIGEGRHTPSVFHNLALCLEGLGRIDHAILTADEGLRSFPDHPHLLLMRGILLTKKGKPGGACLAFEAYVGAAPRAGAHPAAYFAFSVLALAGSGRLSEARARGEEGLALYPRHAPLLLHIGLVLERRQQMGAAIASYRRAFDEDPGLTSARRALADALYQQDRLDEAGELYRDLLAETPSSTEIRFRLGQIAYERGNRREAIDYWRETLEADPTHSRARTKLEHAQQGLQSTGR